MQIFKAPLSPFDKFLFGGLGCGILVLCILGGWIFYIMQTMPVPRSSTTEVVEAPTNTPAGILPEFPTPTLLPTLPSTEAGAPPTEVPAPLPTFFGDASPAGKIVFTCYVEQIDQICIMNADGSGRKQLTHLDATSFYASLSPDGETVYFVSKRTGVFEIYSMSIKGKDLLRLTKNIGSLYAPELAPDGKRIVFTNNGNGVWIMKSDGENPHAISFRDDIDPTWSPDGSMIAFASSRGGQRQLYVMNANGSDVRQVTDLNNMGGRSSWSPEGTKLAFYRGPAGDHDIYVINIDGTDLHRLTHGGDNLGPSWSPDGNWIAFTSFRDGNNEIYIMHPDGTGVTRLTDNFISDWQPRWGR